MSRSLPALNDLPVNEVDGLEEIGLPGPVGPTDDGDSGVELGSRVGEVAEPAALDCTRRPSS